MAIANQYKRNLLGFFKKNKKTFLNTGIAAFSIFIVVALLYEGYNNYLLFHSIIELFSIIIAFTIFFISINTYDISKNNYYMFIGIAYGFVASFDVLHVFTYKGMNIFKGGGSDLPTQLWIISRYLESISLLVANIYFYKKHNFKKVLTVYSVITVILILSVFYWDIFPKCYIEGVGLTQFKKVSEYIISGILLTSLIFISLNKKSLHEDISGFLILSILVKILSEIFFTTYIGVYDIFNLLGHILKTISFYLIYKALIKTLLKEPHKLMFYKLNKTREKLITKNTSLLKSKNRLRTLIKFSPHSIVVFHKGKIIFSNSAFLKLIGEDTLYSVIGKNVISFIHPDYYKTIKMEFRAFENKDLNTISDFKIINNEGKILDVEVSLTKLVYNNKPSIYAVIQDVTQKKKELNRAALIQRKKMEQPNPLPHYIKLEKIYKPYFAVGGDFFIFNKINDKSFICLLGDITGKGITAALHNSALRVLFSEALETTKDPYEILHYINLEVKKYLDEDYVAACCFKFDFENNKANICSAGINEYIYIPKGEQYRKDIIVGPFLGMLDSSPFNSKEILFKKGDRFYFNTDGFEMLFENEKFLEKCFELQALDEQMEYMVENLLVYESGQYDDSTCLGIEIM